MTKPLDKYDLHDRLTDSKRCWAEAIACIRIWRIITGEYAPIEGEKDRRFVW